MCYILSCWVGVGPAQLGSSFETARSLSQSLQMPWRDSVSLARHIFVWFELVCNSMYQRRWQLTPSSSIAVVTDSYFREGSRGHVFHAIGLNVKEAGAFDVGPFRRSLSSGAGLKKRSRSGLYILIYEFSEAAIDLGCQRQWQSACKRRRCGWAGGGYIENEGSSISWW